MIDPRTLRAREEYLGKHYFSKAGEEFEVIELNSVADVTVRFLESGFIKHTNMGNIKMGLPSPFKKNSPICFDSIQHELIGNVYPTNQGDYIKILDVKTKAEVTYQFQDNKGAIGTTTIQNIRNGQVRNPYHPNEFGGYLGVGIYNNDQYSNIYRIWYNLIIRGTGNRARYSNKDYYENSRAYKDTDICPEWMNYNTFAYWYVTNIGKLNPNYEYEIDKDILFPFYCNKTNNRKYYSPTTCVLVTHELNVMLANHGKPRFDQVELTSKIRELVLQLKADNAISDRAYNALVLTLFPNSMKKGVEYPRIKL